MAEIINACASQDMTEMASTVSMLSGTTAIYVIVDHAAEMVNATSRDHLTCADVEQVSLAMGSIVKI